MTRFPAKLAAGAAFAAAFGASLIAFPLILDSAAFALDAKPGPSQPPERTFPMPGEMVEARLAFARTALKITDAQAAQWNAVADVIRRHAKEMDAKIAEMRARREAEPARGPDAFNPIDRMERHRKTMTERATELGELIAAAKPLYATLSDEQKQVADRLLMGGMQGEGRGPHPGPGGWDRDGGPPPR